jgi:hypothetical protein
MKSRYLFIAASIFTMILFTTGCTQPNDNTPSYSVTYDGNGGTGGTVPTDSTGYGKEEQVTVLDNTGNLAGAIIRDGIKQRFIGWNTNSGAATALYAAGDTFSITANTTLYAIYTTGTDVLRKVGPAGGWVFYDAGSAQSWGRYLECAPASTEWTGKQWGKVGTSVVGTKTAVGTGKSNTDLIVAVLNAAPAETDRAALLADALTYGGYSDWFLPSEDELYQMCWVLNSRKWNESDAEDNPAYGTDRVGDFDNSGFAGKSAYWSSSEGTSGNYVCGQNFYNGYQSNNMYWKNEEYQVRAIRAF